MSPDRPYVKLVTGVFVYVAFVADRLDVSSEGEGLELPVYDFLQR